MEENIEIQGKGQEEKESYLDKNAGTIAIIFLFVLIFFTIIALVSVICRRMMNRISTQVPV